MDYLFRNIPDMPSPAELKDEHVPLQKLLQYFDHNNLQYEVRTAGNSTVIVVKKKNRGRTDTTQKIGQ